MPFQPWICVQELLSEKQVRLRNELETVETTILSNMHTAFTLFDINSSDTVRATKRSREHPSITSTPKRMRQSNTTHGCIITYIYIPNVTVGSLPLLIFISRFILWVSGVSAKQSRSTNTTGGRTCTLTCLYHGRGDCCYGSNLTRCNDVKPFNLARIWILVCCCHHSRLSS